MSTVRIAVAASGGLDSTALLHCTARLAAAHGLEVHALHVHHGLQIEADRWQRQVAAQCRRWRNSGMPLHFHAHRIASRPGLGDSVEAWARNARYRALGQMARSAGCGLVLLAHHRRDQAETVLLQALRGAGPAGLSAMPGVVEREGLTWARPWLNQPRAVIEGYVRRWRLAFVEDPSNVDTRFARNRLRHDVWPAMAAGFSDVEVTLSAVARRAQEARTLADEMAQLDLPLVSGDRGLDVAAWAALSPGRRVNALRHWLNLVLDAPVPESLVQRLLAELPGCVAGRWPTAPAADGLRVHRGWLQLVTPPPAASPATLVSRPDVRALDLSRLGSHVLSPWPGRVHVRAVTEGGVPADLLRQAQLRSRSGGERFQAHPLGPPRSLKKQFQAQQVPAWLRDGPLVYVADQLVCVPALGLDARALAWPGSPRRSLHFER
jgi:tRNA(Ile)-lysidine synthase